MTVLPAASVAPGSVRASEIGFSEGKGKSRTSRGWKFPPRKGLSLTSISLDSALTSILVSAAPTSSRGSNVVVAIRLHADSWLRKLRNPGCATSSSYDTEIDGVETINAGLVALRGELRAGLHAGQD